MTREEWKTGIRERRRRKIITQSVKKFPGGAEVFNSKKLFNINKVCSHIGNNSKLDKIKETFVSYFAEAFDQQKNFFISKNNERFIHDSTSNFIDELIKMILNEAVSDKAKLMGLLPKLTMGKITEGNLRDLLKKKRTALWKI